MLHLRRALAVLASAALSWASVVDNPAVCPDEIEHGAGGGEHSTPPSSHCCLGSPCHTPTAAPSAPAFAAPPAPVPALFVVAFAAPDSAETPAPPTPPPTSLDRAV